MKTKRAAPHSRRVVISRHKARLRAKRPLHKRFALHPVSVFVLLCSGVLLFGWTLKTTAASSNTQNGIPPVTLGKSATITNLMADSHYKTKPIEVVGTCPTNSYIKIFRSGVFAGAQKCISRSNRFDLQIDLVPGVNQLQAQDYNAADSEGPQSPAIPVYYDPAVPPAEVVNVNPASGSLSSVTTIQPLTLVSDYSYANYSPGQNVSLRININGGVAPYGLSVSWGDAQQSTSVQKTLGDLTISHSYDASGSYAIKINASDDSSNTAYLQTFALVSEGGNNLLSLGNSQSTEGGSSSGLNASSYSWLWIAWPAYLIVAMMVLSFWLGERAELHKLMQKRSHAHRRR